MVTVLQFLVLLIFVGCISDVRNKQGMLPLVNTWLIVGVKCCYPLPISLYGYVLLTLKQPRLSDILALVLTACGTFLAVKAKVDLGRHHTWAGYYLENGALCTTGVYAWLRHPLYTGIGLFVGGALLTIILHASWVVTLIVLVTVLAIIPFLIVVARRETNWLAHQYPAPFAAYREHVPAVLPRRSNRRSPQPTDP